MAVLKTKCNDQSVKVFLNGITDEKKRREAFTILTLMEKVTQAKPKMWGSSIVGFGSYHFKYESGREGDGRISRSEYKGLPDLRYTTMTFDQVDLNGDGFITPEEYGVAGSIQHGGGGPSQADLLFRILDSDQDGKISTQEWPWNARSFQCIDNNGDGYIVQQEVAR